MLVTLVMAAFAIAARPTHPARFPAPVDGLLTLCFSEDDCLPAIAVDDGVDGGCRDLPLFNESFATASLSATGLECILSPDSGCSGNTGLTGILLPTAGTVELSALGITNVASYLCTSDVDTVNLCWPEVTMGCFQATTITNGCGDLTRFSVAYASVYLTTNGTQCTFFQDDGCAGPSAVVTEAEVTIDLDTLGINNVMSLNCTNDN
ncbi:hypothetical protein BT96DRAFT_928933 [Gymnopus androsaceus JB14]|uniref:Uncharacterized protein n=1 Tax=Gymnopus androsaceus JB14 TaxID=1447944 RepID=A0A6A4GHQ5_9AGAR|nr:hypothetical protein BT96DRAFT_928933 [Gymnopus androsaceus JB14]